MRDMCCCRCRIVCDVCRASENKSPATEPDQSRVHGWAVFPGRPGLARAVGLSSRRPGLLLRAEQKGGSPA